MAGSAANICADIAEEHRGRGTDRRAREQAAHQVASFDMPELVRQHAEYGVIIGRKLDQFVGDVNYAPGQRERIRSDL